MIKPKAFHFSSIFNKDSSTTLLFASFLYLVFPFLIFTFGWYRWFISVIVLFAMGVVFKNILSGQYQDGPIRTCPDKTQWISIVLLGIWITLSGIGEHFYQNHDFQWRNALFRDLINFHWPVIYTFSIQHRMELVYYIGIWLPAALVGKVLGWQAANFVLFLWIGLGVYLATKLIALSLKVPQVLTVVLFMFFSGSDGIGVVTMHAIGLNSYPTLWPPIQHLEWWAKNLQFSSFTTQLFWVYNQAVPAWVCTSLLIYGINKRWLGLVMALCCFYAPLPAIGLAPFVLIQVFLPDLYTKGTYSFALHLQTGKHLWKNFRQCLTNIFSFENVIAGGIVLFLTYVYMKGNQTKGLIQVDTPTPALLGYVLVFIILESSLLFVFVYRRHRDNIFFYVAVLLLLIAPFIQIGIGQDFVMRASIPSLLFLMVWTGETLFTETGLWRKKIKILVLVPLLGLTCLTPLYEMNRSMYRTANFYLCPVIRVPILCSNPLWIEPNVKAGIDEDYQPELDHPGSLTADDLISFSQSESKYSINFLAPPDDSILGQLIVK